MTMVSRSTTNSLPPLVCPRLDTCNVLSPWRFQINVPQKYIRLYKCLMMR